MENFEDKINLKDTISIKSFNMEDKKSLNSEEEMDEEKKFLLQEFNNEDHHYILFFANKEINRLFTFYICKDFEKNKEDLKIFYSNEEYEDLMNVVFGNLIILSKKDIDFDNFYDTIEEKKINDYILNLDKKEEIFKEKTINYEEEKEININKEELEEIKNQNELHKKEIEALKDSKNQTDEMNAFLVNQVTELQITMNEIISSIFDE